MEPGEGQKRLKSLERVKGIEPSYSAWKAAALPLSYTRAPGMTYHAMPMASTAGSDLVTTKSQASTALSALKAPLFCP